jgi:hypothetical protein
VAAAWKQVKSPQVGQCGSHEVQAVSEHLENPVPLAADVERRLFDAASLEVPVGRRSPDRYCGSG